MLTLFGIVLSLPQLGLVWLYLRSRDGIGFLRNWAGTAGWLSLWILPAVLAHVVYLRAGLSSSSFGFDDLFQMIPMSWTVLLGGLSVQMLFEETAKAISGHRQSTMLDNLGWYLILTWVQLALVSLFCTLRNPTPKRTGDRVAIAFGVALMVNGLLGIGWPWWGS